MVHTIRLRLNTDEVWNLVSGVSLVKQDGSSLGLKPDYYVELNAD